MTWTETPEFVEEVTSLILYTSDEECWGWRGTIDASGYARVRSYRWATNRGIDPYGHRAVYQLFKGTIPEGLELDHLCRNRSCVNPRHLQAVTHAENSRRGDSPFSINRRRTECANGHPFDAKNTGYTTNGTRRCRACNREHMRRARSQS